MFINRTKSGGHFVDVKQSSVRHIIIWRSHWRVWYFLYGKYSKINPHVFTL